MLEPFERLFTQPSTAPPLPLPPELAALYGELAFPVPHTQPYVISNFVSTLDGVVSLGILGKSGGGEISGFNRHDRALMGLLRASAAAVVVGAGTLRAVPQHLWTPEYVFPELSEAFAALRRALGLAPRPLNVILSGSGRLDLSAPVFASGAVETLVVTTPAGAARLRAAGLPSSVRIRAVESSEGGRLVAREVLAEIAECMEHPAPLVLVEGGPRLMADFLAEGQIDELFLTIAPQVAGRADGPDMAERPGLVAGRLFAPDQPVWGTLASLHRAGSHLFLRYQLTGTGAR